MRSRLDLLVEFNVGRVYHRAPQNRVASRFICSFIREYFLNTLASPCRSSCIPLIPCDLPRCMLHELAWTQQLPALAYLPGRDNVPRKERHLKRPPTPEQDQLIQRELLRRDDLLSNALLLLGHKIPLMTLEYLEVRLRDVYPAG